MKISRQRRQRQEPEEHISDSIFDAISSTGGSQQKEKVKTKGPTIEELQAKLTEVNARLDQQERDRAMSDSRSDPRPVQQDIGQAPALNLDGLPDPVTDVKAFAAEMYKRTETHRQAMQAWETKRQQAIAPPTYGDPEALWEDFTSANPTYAEDESGIRFATSEVAARLAKRRVDVAKYMYTKSDLFFQDVIKEYDKRFGAPETNEEDVDQQHDERAVQERRVQHTRHDDDGDDGRTAGILSGSENAVRPGPKGPPPGDLIKDLQDIQRRSGYF